MLQVKNKYVISILIILFFVSTALNLLLLNKAKNYYILYNNVQLDPLGLNYFTDNNQSIQKDAVDQRKVVFFGDSRAAQWEFPDMPGQFHFINRGIGGQTSLQIAERFTYHINPLQPHVIIVQAGINDLKMIPFFPGKKETIISNCKKNISIIISKSLDIGAIVIITTIFPTGELPFKRAFFWSDEATEAITDVNNYLHSLKGSNVFIIDTAAILANEKGIVRKEFSKDFLHINTAGYRALNNELLSLLAKSAF